MGKKKIFDMSTVLIVRLSCVWRMPFLTSIDCSMVSITIAGIATPRVFGIV